MTKIINAAPGYVENPAKKYSRNLRCICQSGKKIKHCHGKNDFVPVDQARDFLSMVKFVNDQYLKHKKEQYDEKAKAIQSQKEI